ncbi:hypothetical protein HN385_01770 [archaeon]|jgi:hypothetical protein|nr:hypothetical protein [archaeon]MBT3451557.1 hypothetical protein [archaeon]MBT6869416.1 hypothetical protein [archaeon]MBT7192579.1 hypothetical protein [archaeon]MBT7380655.1 hypothetical protein [archaeon]
MSYNRNPLKHNRFRRPDGSLDFSNFWPNRRKLEKQDEIDPEERSNAEVAQSISTIVNHMGQTKKHPQERNTNEVKVIRRNTTSYLSQNDKNACIVLNNYLIDLRSLVLNPLTTTGHNLSEIKNSPLFLREINQRLKKDLVKNYLSQKGIKPLGLYSLYLDQGLLKIRDKKRGNLRLRLDHIVSCSIQTTPRINSIHDTDLRLIHFPSPSDYGKVMYQLHNPETQEVVKAGLFYRTRNNFRIYEVLR